MFVPEVGAGGNILPDVTAADGTVVHLPGGLADGPDHAEITNGGAYRLVRTFEHLYRKALLREGPCRSQSDDTGANNYC